MRYACEYDMKNGMVGLIIFTATSLEAARIYLEELVEYNGHDHVYNLNELIEGTVAELYRLYPKIAQVTVRGSIPKKAIEDD